jgi:putative multiple sugar transport system ATP-binding protein
MKARRTLVKDIGVGKQQLVEIAKALAKDVRLLILDEPTSSLNESDARKLLDLLLALRRDKGVTSIIISHKLNEIAYVADKITILRDGATIKRWTRRPMKSPRRRIIRGMVGRSSRTDSPGGPPTPATLPLKSSIGRSTTRSTPSARW